MNTCAVLIPIYKSEMNENELCSLRQALRVLMSYPLVLVAPKGLSLENYLSEYRGFRIEYFDPIYFEGIAGYNKLMMSPEFYGRFQSNLYILIYQLDAYVFRDELEQWCEKGYDYIGAPWTIAPPAIPNAKKPLVDLSKKLLGKVGNGGLSLRKVQTHLRIAKLMKPFVRFFPKNEDFFWSVIVPKFVKFKRPSVEEALTFAIELEPSKAFERNGKRLPFGCHAWEKYEPEFWQQHIQP